MSSKQYKIHISTSDFSSKFYNDLEKQNLLQLDIIQQNIDKFLFRGNRRFEKSWWNLFTRYKYIYLIFDFTIEIDHLFVISNWYEGNDNGPFASQNKIPTIPLKLVSIETNIYNDIELLVNNDNL